MPRVEQTDWLETFVAVIDHGSFSGAARALHRAQSRVSTHVASLEKALGGTLVDRSHRPIGPTELGTAFLPTPAPCWTRWSGEPRPSTPTPALRAAAS